MCSDVLRISVCILRKLPFGLSTCQPPPPPPPTKGTTSVKNIPLSKAIKFINFLNTYGLLETPKLHVRHIYTRGMFSQSVGLEMRLVPYMRAASFRRQILLVSSDRKRKYPPFHAVTAAGTSDKLYSPHRVDISAQMCPCRRR